VKHVETIVNMERKLTKAELDAVSGGLTDASKNEVAIEGLVSAGVGGRISTQHPAKVTVPDIKLG
jgi:hypothetical protein